MSKDPFCEEYLTFNATHGLFPTHTFPTRISICIDHLLMKSFLPYTTLVLESNLTDHLPITLYKDIINPIRQPTSTKTRTDYLKVQTDLENVDFETIYLSRDLNLAVNTLTDVVANIIKQNTKVLSVRKKNRILKP